METPKSLILAGRGVRRSPGRVVAYTGLVLFLLLLLLCLPPPSSTDVWRQLPQEHFDYHGPYVDEVVFTVYHGSEAQWAAIHDGLIDVGNEPITPQLDPDIQWSRWEANAFWGLAVSTHYWPLTYPVLRRAIAMAIDKYKVTQLGLGSHGVALDHVVPPSLGPWHNPNLPFDFRSGDLEGAIELLESNDFRDWDGNGYRETPNGTEINMGIFYYPGTHISSPVGPTNTTAMAEYIDEVLAGLGFNHHMYAVSEETLYRITHYGRRKYQLALLPFAIPDRTPHYLKDLFYSWNIPYTNIFNFSNETVDTLLDEMLSADSFGEVQQAVWDLQAALAENQPLIPLCTRYTYIAYRTDKFEGWVDLPGVGVANPWSLLQVRLKQDQPDRNPVTGVGGTLEVGLGDAPDTLNPLVVSVDDTWLVLDAIYSRLVEENPLTGQPIPGLAYNWVLEPEDDGLRITFNLLDNVTWHDGVPFNALDVNFTYYYVNNLPGSWPYPWPKPHIEFTEIEVPNNVTVVIHTPLTGYFALLEIARQPILPRHIWEGIKLPALFQNPRPVGTGPFRFVQRPEAGLIFLEYNPDYHYRIPGSRELPPYVDVHLLAWTTAGIAVVAMTIVASVWYLRRTPHGFAP